MANTPSRRSAPNRHRQVAGLLLLASAALAPAAAAQPASTRQFLPDSGFFRAPLADPLEPRFGVALVHTDILATRGPERPPFFVADSAGAAREVQAHAAIGGTLPLILLGTWPGGGWALTGQAAAFARFRIELPSRDNLAEDWLVAGAIEARWDRLALRARIRHQSSHMGDEFMATAGAGRIEYGGEELDVLAARFFGAGAWRLYGGGTWIFRSYTDKTAVLRALERGDRFQLQGGADGAWRPWADPRHTVVAGVDARLAERTDYRLQLAAVAGWRFANPHGELGFQLRVHDGPSFQGEFFLTPERTYQLEFVVIRF
ncbi:MAG: DUF1207 domain-containing protein [Gemmatimonadota bacterium]